MTFNPMDIFNGKGKKLNLSLNLKAPKGMDGDMKKGFFGDMDPFKDDFLKNPTKKPKGMEQRMDKVLDEKANYDACGMMFGKGVLFPTSSKKHNKHKESNTWGMGANLIPNSRLNPNKGNSSMWGMASNVINQGPLPKHDKNTTNAQFMRMTKNRPEERFIDHDKDRVVSGLDAYPFDARRKQVAPQQPQQQLQTMQQVPRVPQKPLTLPQIPKAPQPRLMQMTRNRHGSYDRDGDYDRDDDLNGDGIIDPYEESQKLGKNMVGMGSSNIQG